LLSHFEFISLVPCYDDPVDFVARCLELLKVVDMEGRTEMIDDFVLVTIFVVAVAVSNGGVLFCLMLRYLMCWLYQLCCRRGLYLMIVSAAPSNLLILWMLLSLITENGGNGLHNVNAVADTCL
jgi:hypothetical protein